jgi:hypothetical protein
MPKQNLTDRLSFRTIAVLFGIFVGNLLATYLPPETVQSLMN